MLLNGILKLVMDSHEIPRHISSLFSQPGWGKGTRADWKRFTLRSGLRLLFWRILNVTHAMILSTRMLTQARPEGRRLVCWSACFRCWEGSFLQQFL